MTNRMTAPPGDRHRALRSPGPLRSVVVTAAMLGALALALPVTAQAATPHPTAVVTPAQPPIPPGPPVPPPMEEPGQAGPAPGVQDTPPAPMPPEPNEQAICQDIMGVTLPPGCFDPSQTV